MEVREKMLSLKNFFLRKEVDLYVRFIQRAKRKSKLRFYGRTKFSLLFNITSKNETNRSIILLLKSLKSVDS